FTDIRRNHFSNFIFTGDWTCLGSPEEVEAYRRRWGEPEKMPHIKPLGDIPANRHTANRQTANRVMPSRVEISRHQTVFASQKTGSRETGSRHQTVNPSPTAPGRSSAPVSGSRHANGISNGRTTKEAPLANGNFSIANRIAWRDVGDFI